MGTIPVPESLGDIVDDLSSQVSAQIDTETLAQEAESILVEEDRIERTIADAEAARKLVIARKTALAENFLRSGLKSITTNGGLKPTVYIDSAYYAYDPETGDSIRYDEENLLAWFREHGYEAAITTSVQFNRFKSVCAELSEGGKPLPPFARKTDTPKIRWTGKSAFLAQKG